MIKSSSDSWLVVNTHPQKEGAVIENLDRQGYHAYCPRIRKRIRHARRIQDVLRPLFPGYVFVRLNPCLQQWHPIASTFGVRNLIRFGERPGIVPNQFLAGLLESERDGAVTIPRARDTYKPGEIVRMREGVFDGIIATVLAVGERDRIVVLMDLLRRSVKVGVSIDEVVPA